MIWKDERRARPSERLGTLARGGADSAGRWGRRSLTVAAVLAFAGVGCGGDTEKEAAEPGAPTTEESTSTDQGTTATAEETSPTTTQEAEPTRAPTRRPTSRVLSSSKRKRVNISTEDFTHAKVPTRSVLSGDPRDWNCGTSTIKWTPEVDGVNDFYLKLLPGTQLSNAQGDKVTLKEPALIITEAGGSLTPGDIGVTPRKGVDLSKYPEDRTMFTYAAGSGSEYKLKAAGGAGDLGIKLSSNVQLVDAKGNVVTAGGANVVTAGGANVITPAGIRLVDASGATFVQP